jgi:hypothetical protein
LQSEFTSDVEKSLADWNAKYPDNPEANALGIMNAGPVYSLNGGTNNAIAPWQHNFLTWSAGHAAELGFTGAAEFRNWLAQFEIGLMTDWQTHSAAGFCWLQASAYDVQVKDAAGNWLPSFTAVYAATWPTLPSYACNSPAMVAELAKVRNAPVQAGEMPGYAYSNVGYPANFQIGVAAAANSGLPNAQAAWNLFDSRSVKPSGNDSYTNYPNFAVIPRPAETGAGALPPNVPLPATIDPPVATSSPVTNPTPIADPQPPATVGNLFGPENPPAAAHVAQGTGGLQDAVDEICNRVALFCAKLLPTSWYSPAAQASGAPRPAASKAPTQVYLSESAQAMAAPDAVPASTTAKVDVLAYRTQSSGRTSAEQFANNSARTAPAASVTVKLVLPPCPDTNRGAVSPAVNSDCEVSAAGVYRITSK